jgi:hypothetical protein
MDEVRSGAPAPVQAAIDLMDLTSRAADLFLIQPTHEKQAFLRLVLHSVSWKHGELQTQFEEPFENLRRSNQLSRSKEKEMNVMINENEIWLPIVDSNRVENGFPNRSRRVFQVRHPGHNRGNVILWTLRTENERLDT